MGTDAEGADLLLPYGQCGGHCEGHSGGQCSLEYRSTNAAMIDVTRATASAGPRLSFIIARPAIADQWWGIFVGIQMPSVFD